MKSRRGLQTVLAMAAVLLWGTAVRCGAQFAAPDANASSAASIPQSALLQPDVLNRLLLLKSAEKPLILQVGSRLFFAEAHIPGAVFSGPGSQAAGLQLLQIKVAGLKRDRPIVIYCGCCPWDRCPNLGPAYKLLRTLGFTNVKALYLANNFGDDWVNKGYAVEEGL